MWCADHADHNLRCRQRGELIFCHQPNQPRPVDRSRQGRISPRRNYCGRIAGDQRSFATIRRDAQMTCPELNLQPDRPRAMSWSTNSSHHQQAKSRNVSSATILQRFLGFGRMTSSRAAPAGPLSLCAAQKAVQLLRTSDKRRFAVIVLRGQARGAGPTP